MSNDPDIPEPDRLEGAPHPRETQRLIGQDTAEAGFLEAFNTGRLHHGWLLIGPEGIGKATLAWRIARFLLATPAGGETGLFGAPETLDIDPDHPVARRVHAGSEPGLFVLKRPYDEKTKKLKTQITVDEVRRLKGFFALSSADGGRRVVIVDCADDMNTQAANALLKLLEEPPENTTILLISHQPSRLLPTIRSRCRELRLRPLATPDLAEALAQAGAEGRENAEALATLSGGSVGGAMRLDQLGGLAVYAQWLAVMGSLPRLDRARAMGLAESAAARGAQGRLDLILDMIDLLLARMARSGALGRAPTPEAAPGEGEVFARLCPNAQSARKWAAATAEITARSRHGQSVNLDPVSLVLDTVFKLQKTASDPA